jgi:nucleoside-diphosphate-sugar epimerase
VVVSGATGFLGRAACDHLAARGFAVRGLARDPDAARAVEPGFAWFLGRLPDACDPRAFEGALALVHCAWETRFRSERRSWSVNVEGSRGWFAAARSAGVGKLVFVSSMSAHEDTESPYGRTKRAVEALLDPERDVALRPGTIVGEGGVFWRQARAVATLPFIPVFFGGDQRFHTVALADVCRAIGVAVETDLRGTVGVGEPASVGLREFYAAIALALGRRPRFLPVPGHLALAALRAAECLGFRLPLSSDNLLGLKCLRAFELERDVERLGFTPRPLRESLAEIRWDRLAPP